ncbi:coiled-coil domain-containing protein 39 [Takifugu flavidus]|uniref:Coiled-coil domain-containing protein 39 n=1 Tax=Takifugu flavidus TaxID=433684 RepID=A0A5C6P1A6_9TELE|nr:coiled-coil domain-containing protein 39 [Takifugu flavidus]TWW72836.1 Coiled-coil domain-containing protein 39 [Takifugu flavidus]
MKNISGKILTELCWDDSFHVPEANAENKTLIEEIRKAELQLTQLNNDLEKHEDEQDYMNGMLKNLGQELKTIDALGQAKEREVESVKHLTALEDREIGHLTGESSKINKEQRSLGDRRSTQENQIFRARQKLDEFRNQKNWDREILDAFLEESSRQEEDIMVIMKYAQQDEQKITSLTLAIEKKNLEAKQKRKALNKEWTETQSVQAAMDKITEEVRQTILETNQLTQWWENIVTQMKQQDTDSQTCAAKLAQHRQTIRERNFTLAEAKHLLDTLSKNNRETELSLSKTRRQAFRLQQDVKEQEKKCSRLKDETESCKATRDRAISDVEAGKSNISRMKREMEENTQRLEDVAIHNFALEEKLEELTQSSLNQEDRAARMDQFLNEEELAMKRLEDQLQEQQEELFCHKEELNTLRTQEKDTTARVSSNKTEITRLEKQMRSLENELSAQRSTVEGQENQLSSLGLKLSLLRGDVQSDEKQILEAKIAELTGDVEEKKKSAAALSSILKEAEDEIRSLRNKMEKSETRRRDLSNTVEELMLICDTSEKELNKLVCVEQDTMVENNILKVEVKRVRDLLFSQLDRVYSLEKRKLDLQRTIKEREDDIMIFRKMLSQQLKTSEEERQRLSLELNEKLTEIKGMENYHEVMMSSTAPPGGEQDRSQAYYITEAAQEREELRQKADLLDAKIHKMEQENKALQNTGQLISSCNSAFRKSLQQVDESSPESRGDETVEEQVKTLEEMLNYKKRQIQELHQDTEDFNNLLESSLKKELQVEEDKTEHKKSFIFKLKKDLSSQQEKISRTTKQCSRLSREIHSSGSACEGLDSVALRQMKEFRRSRDRMLHEAMKDKPDLRSAFESHYLEANLSFPSLPSTPSSKRSSLLNSARSSASLRSSLSSAARASVHPSLEMKTVELGLELPVTPPTPNISGRSSCVSSSRKLKSH